MLLANVFPSLCHSAPAGDDHRQSSPETDVVNLLLRATFVVGALQQTLTLRAESQLHDAEGRSGDEREGGSGGREPLGQDRVCPPPRPLAEDLACPVWSPAGAGSSSEPACFLQPCFCFLPPFPSLAVEFIL